MTSRSLLAGIFTVRRIDFLASSGGFDGDRETVTEGEEGIPVAPLRGLDMVLERAELDEVVRAAWERRERRVDMMACSLEVQSSRPRPRPS